MTSDRSWRKVRFGDVVELRRDTVRPQQRGDELLDHYSFAAHDDGRRPQREPASSIKSNKYRVESGAVLLSKLNPHIPRVWAADPDPDVVSVASTEFLVLHPRDGLERNFLPYLCQSSQVLARMQELVTGTSGSHQRVKPADVMDLSVHLPPLDEQRRIAGILRALDHKIEVNARIRHRLEQLNRALFRALFVDFEPMTVPGSPVHEWASMYPSGLRSTSLGPVPDGWEIVELGDFVDVVKGTSYRSEDLTPSDTGLVNLKSVARHGGYQPEGLKGFSGNHKPQEAVSPGEIIVAVTDMTQAAEVIGRPARVASSDRFGKLVASLDIAIVRPSEPLTNHYLYELLNQVDFTDHALRFANGTTVLHLGKQALPSYRFAVPPQPIIERYTEFADVNWALHDVTLQESVNLASARETLLEPLVTGQVDFSHTIAAAEAVA